MKFTMNKITFAVAAIVGMCLTAWYLSIYLSILGGPPMNIVQYIASAILLFDGAAISVILTWAILQLRNTK